MILEKKNLSFLSFNFKNKPGGPARIDPTLVKIQHKFNNSQAKIYNPLNLHLQHN